MSDFIPALIDLLPEHNSLKNPDNELRKVLDRSVGEWFDHYSVQDLYDGLFLTSATGEWLDLHGRDYGVVRQDSESDDDYRNRIVQEKIEHLTPSYLETLYDLKLYNYFETVNISQNTMVSDNVYLPGAKMAEYSDKVSPIVTSKFILDNNLYWIVNGVMDYIYDVNNVNILGDYLNIYDLGQITDYFRDNTLIKTVKLILNKAASGYNAFQGCTNLTSVNLIMEIGRIFNDCFVDCSKLTTVNIDAPVLLYAERMFKGCSKLNNVTLVFPTCSYMSNAFENCTDLVEINLTLPKLNTSIEMFKGCSKLEKVVLNTPKLNTTSRIFNDCPKLKYIDIKVVSSKVNSLKTYINSLNLQYLETLIINDEEVDLS